MNNEIFDPEVGAWVPRPSALWALLAGLIIGGLVGIAMGVTIGTLWA